MNRHQRLLQLLSVFPLLGAIPALQATELYRTPLSQKASQEDQAKSCIELEHEIAYLTPLTYSYKPGFYQDPYQGASVAVGTAIFWPAYGLLGYSGYLDYKENERIISAEERINLLRQLKAEKRCFEN